MRTSSQNSSTRFAYYFVALRRWRCACATDSMQVALGSLLCAECSVLVSSAQIPLCKCLCASGSTRTVLRKLLCASCSTQVCPRAAHGRSMLEPKLNAVFSEATSMLGGKATNRNSGQVPLNTWFGVTPASTSSANNALLLVLQEPRLPGQGSGTPCKRHSKIYA